MNTGDQGLTLRSHTCGVAAVDFSADGSMLASVSSCDGVRVWAIDIDDLLDIARREVLPALSDSECRRYIDLESCPAQPSA